MAEEWPSVLHDLGRTVGAAGAVMLANSNDRWSGSWSGHVTSPEFEEAFSAFLQSDVPQRTQTTPRLLALDRAGFVHEAELFSAAEWESEPLKADWSTEWGFDHAAATAIHSPSGELLVFHLERRAGLPQFIQSDLDLLDAYRPHLARAGLLATRWRLERLQIVADALAQIGLPAAVVAPNARVLAANELIQAMTQHIIWLPKNAIALADPAANALLRRAIQEITRPAAASPRTFPTRAMAGVESAIVHMIPTPRRARDVFDGALGVLVITPLTSPDTPDVNLIRGLFDLTHSEAKVARGITQGLTISEIATRDGIHPETVRSQVKAVFAKTGTRRQAEVAALLAGVPRIPVVKPKP